MVTRPAPIGEDPIVVTGLGLITSLGFGVDANWTRLLAGDSGIAEVPAERFALPVSLPVRLGAEVPREALAERIRAAVPRSVWNTSAPECHIWLLAALEALTAARLLDEETGRLVNDGAGTGIYVGTGGGAHGFAESEYIRIYTAEKAVQRDVSRFAVPTYMASSLAAQLSIVTGIDGPAMVLNTACASGSTALLTALDALRVGRVNRAVVGGADLTLTAATLKGFANLTALSGDTEAGRTACRPFDATRGGLVLGEGAACLVLERASTAARRGAAALSALLGGATSAEAHHLLHPRDHGTGMAACMASALAEADVPAQQVAHVYAHGTGTRTNDTCEAEALQAVLPHRPTVSASKAQLGHTLGAGGAIDAVLATLSLSSGRVPPLRFHGAPDPACAIRAAEIADNPALCPTPRAGHTMMPAVMVNSFAFGGHNACLLFGSAAGINGAAPP